MQTLSNKELTIKINTFGAELSSIVKNENSKEYLWQGDPQFWKRRSPVLFPIVGSLWNGEYREKGETYKMSQHGFARDMDFNLIHETSDEVLYSLTSNEETLKLYPFHFELNIGYKLVDNKLEVIWKVKNIGSVPMHFQIGAHPAFYYPNAENLQSEKGFFSFDTSENISYTIIAEKGCVDPEIHYPLDLDDDNFLPINDDTFGKDALILEDNQVQTVTLLNLAKEPLLSLHFDAPLVGLWAPSKDSPFVCIEPWYGRCDRINYTGDLENRDWMNHLDAGKTFETSYTIEIK